MYVFPFYLLFIFVFYFLHCKSIDFILSEKHHKISLFISLSLLFILIGLRHVDVGMDTKSYQYEFINSEYYFLESLRGLEVGFSLLLYTAKKIGFDFYAFLLVASFFGFYPLYKLGTFFKASILIYILLLITVGFIAFSMSGLRQYLAIVIVLYGVLIHRKNVFFAYFLLFIAFFVHGSSAIFSIVFILFTWATRLFSFEIILLFTMFFVFLVKIFTTNILALLIGVGLYNSGYLYDSSYTNMKVVSLHFFLLFSSFLLLYLNRKNKSEYDVYTVDVRGIVIEKFAFYCMFIVPAIVILSTEVKLVERVALYFMPFQCVYIAHLFSSISNDLSSLIIKFLFFIVLLVVSNYLFISIDIFYSFKFNDWFLNL